MKGETMSEAAGIAYLKGLLAYVRNHHEAAFAYFQEVADQQVKSAVLWKAAMMIEGKGCERNVAGALQLAKPYMTTPLDYATINRYLMLYYQEFDNKASILKVLEASVRHKDAQTMFWLAGLHYYGSTHFDMPANPQKAAKHWLLWKLMPLSLPYGIMNAVAEVTLTIPFAQQIILKKIPKYIKETDPKHVSRNTQGEIQALSCDAVGELKAALEELGLSQQEIAAI